jgi:hypothetical protein
MQWAALPRIFNTLSGALVGVAVGEEMAISVDVKYRTRP